MKRNITKFLAALALLVFTMPSLVAWGQTRATVTFTYSDYTGQGGPSGSGSEYTMVKPDVSISDTKFYGNTSFVNLYANGVSTITPASGVTITQIVLTATSTSYNGYQSSGTVTPSTGSVSANGTTVTWTGSANNAFTISHNKQIRWTSIVVTYSTGGNQPAATPTFSPAAGAYTSNQNVSISTTTSGATIYYTTDGTEPTTSSNVYSSAIPVSSTTTIKAIAAATGYDNSSVATATYAILGHAGTESDPYTVADARAAIEAGVGTQGVYVTGTVSGIVEAWSTQHNNISFNISDDGQTTSNQLEAYRCVSTTNANASEVTSGDVVVVSGNLTLYGSTYEFTSGCQLVSLTHPAGTVLDPVFNPAAGGYSGTKSVEITCATEGATIYYTTDGIDPTTASNEYSSAISVSSNTTIKAVAYVGTNHSEVVTASYLLLTDANTTVNTVAYALANYPLDGVFVSGIVCTAPTQAPTSNGELTYYISSNGTETDRLEVYKGKNMDNTAFSEQTDLQVGDIVTVYGNVVIYNSTIEFTTGNYLVAFERPETPVVPVINAPVTVTLEYDATSGEFEYSIENPVQGTNLNATTTAEWISNIVVGESAVTFTTTENEGEEDRSATITLSYEGADNVTVTVTQGHFVVDYATLPFEWAGGTKEDLTALNGVTGSGLGSNYAESNAPYRVKFDTDGDYILIKTNQQPGVVTVGIKKLGGANASSISIQGSTDGETFTTIQEFNNEGAANAVLSHETTVAFGGDDRYVRIYFNKPDGGSNVGVGPITIAQYIAPESHILTIANPDNVTITATYGDEILVNGNVAEVLGGTEISLFLNIAEGYIFESLTVEGEDSQIVNVTESNDHWSFYMPSYNVTVNASVVEAPATENYELFTDALVEGDYVIYYGGYAMKDVEASGRLGYSIVSPSNNVIAADASIVWHIAPSGDYWTIYSADAEKFAASTGAKNKAQLLEDGTDDKALWTVTVENGVYEFVNKANAEANVNCNLRNNGTNGFACYATSTGGALSLYKKVVAPESYTLTVNGYTEGSTGGYVLVASPVSTTPAAAGMITTNSNYDLYYFDDTQEKEWINYKNEDGSVNENFGDLVPGKGYLYANSANVTLTFTGTPYDGNGEFTVPAGWHLLGNPFAETAYIGREFYTMNSNGNGLIASTNVNDPIDAMHGVFVKATAEETVAFSTTAPGKNSESVVLNVMKNRGNVIDRAIVRFGEGSTLPKFQLNPNNTKIYVTEGNQDFAVVRSANEGEMPVSFKASENGTYTLAVETENVEMDYLHLIDNMTGMDVDLLQTPNYTFEAKTNDYASRFRLVFSASNNGTSTAETFAFFNGTSWTVSNQGEATLQVVDVMGRLVSTEQINGNATINLNETAGIYMFRLVNGNDVKVQKIVVR